MIKDKDKINEYYKMLIEKNSNYAGIFYVGVKTTGVFCRPTCPAKKPKKENCEFFHTAKEALLASYRPCKRCQPLNSPSNLSPEVKKLVTAIEENPERKWADKDFDKLSISANTARRQFKKQFGMTFIEYARSRRLGIAFDYIRNGNSVIDTQQEIGYDSGNGFRDAFTKIMGTLPKRHKEITLFVSEWIETPIGSMIAIAKENSLYLLEFTDRRGLEKEIENLRKKFNGAIIPGTNQLLKNLKNELNSYFLGELKDFTIPLAQDLGTPFQRKIWQLLQTIPSGETRSYKELAILFGNSNASRAVARANGTNQISILIPCHRIINTNRELGGYGGGVQRKKWLLEMEKKNYK